MLRQQGLTFTYAVIQVDASRYRRFMVSVRQQNQYWQLTYDEEGQLLAVSNPQTATFFQQLSELPSAIQQYLQRLELAGFGLGANALSLHTYGSMGTYRVNVQKDKQRWLLVFSDKSQLVSRSFLTYQ